MCSYFSLTISIIYSKNNSLKITLSFQAALISMQAVRPAIKIIYPANKIT